ncbi:hypothetical protein IG631_03473 [Alternaria alternata]|nr:hypothetical protein IG631_03473 [Alternaria alternata]
MAHQRFDYSQNSTYLLRHSSWIYRYHRTSRSSSLHRSAGADTACIYRKGSSSRIGLTRDHYFLPPTSRRSHIPISLHVVQMKTTWSLAERTANRKEPCLRVSTHRCCPHLSQTPAAPSIRALRILRASRPGDWEKAFSVYHHLLGWFDHGLCVSVHRSKRLPSDGGAILLFIPVRHTLLEVYEPLGFLTGVRKEIPPAFRPSDVGAIEFRS